MSDPLRVDLAEFVRVLTEANDDSGGYLDQPRPSVEDDGSEGPLNMMIDGWWYADRIEAAIRAAVSTRPCHLPRTAPPCIGCACGLPTLPRTA